MSLDTVVVVMLGDVEILSRAGETWIVSGWAYVLLLVALFVLSAKVTVRRVTKRVEREEEAR